MRVGTEYNLSDCNYLYFIYKYFKSDAYIFND